MKKSAGYALIAIGAILFALSYSPVRSSIGINLPSGVTDLVLMISGVVLVLLSLFLLSKASSANQAEEVPIYHGKNIVGYRRMK